MDWNDFNTIRNKLGRGEELSTSDLISLDPLHDAIYDHEGCIVGNHKPCSSTKCRMEENAPFHLEYLDRSLLDGQCQKSQQHGQQGLPRVVRYVGK